MNDRQIKHVVLFLTAILSATAFLPKYAGLLPCVFVSFFVIQSLKSRSSPVFCLSLFVALTLLLSAPQLLISQLFFTLALLILWFVERRVTWIPRSFPWLTSGNLTIPVFLLISLFVVVAAVALFCWYRWCDPNVSDILSTFFPEVSVGLLFFGGLLFSMLNAAVEEFVYRGFLTHVLEKTFASVWLPILLQAAAFGLLHIHGFPRGWIGVGLAFIYGIFMGIIRQKSGGMLAPWIAHIFTDMIIVLILIFMK